MLCTLLCNATCLSSPILELLLQSAYEADVYALGAFYRRRHCRRLLCLIDSASHADQDAIGCLEWSPRMVSQPVPGFGSRSASGSSNHRPPEHKSLTNSP